MKFLLIAAIMISTQSAFALTEEQANQCHQQFFSKDFNKNYLEHRDNLLDLIGEKAKKSFEENEII